MTTKEQKATWIVWRLSALSSLHCPGSWPLECTGLLNILGFYYMRGGCGEEIVKGFADKSQVSNLLTSN